MTAITGLFSALISLFSSPNRTHSFNKIVRRAFGEVRLRSSTQQGH
jgi:hypothetical protein